MENLIEADRVEADIPLHNAAKYLGSLTVLVVEIGLEQERAPIIELVPWNGYGHPFLQRIWVGTAQCLVVVDLAPRQGSFRHRVNEQKLIYPLLYYVVKTYQHNL